MNLDFEDANISVTSSEILTKITEYDIFKEYCHNFIDFDVKFCSELRNDKLPSCSVTNKYGNVVYKDFGNGDSYNCWTYVMKKFGCSYYEALNIISNDFNIKYIKSTIAPRVILLNDEELISKKNVIKNECKIEVIKQPWTIHDFNYWNQYLIDFETLDKYNVVSAKKVLLYKNSNRWIFDYNNKSPKYAYLFNGCTKVYAPYEIGVGKWMYDGNSDNIEGWNQLDMFGDLVILTKGYKDVICYRNLGINAIALPSETSKLKPHIVKDLLSRFDKIVINLDGDRQGIESTNKIVAEYGMSHFYVENDCKDLSDWIKKYKSLEKAKQMIKDKIDDKN
jgi:hypothetical protein